tara:strand:+ start:5579 stop:5800 length:222 start_codon:yes stop_codon:yes gene_type:complete
MTELSKLTKAQLIDVIQQQEEEKYAVLKEELGLPYNTDEEWVEYIQSKTCPCEECSKLKEEIKRLTLSASRVY